MVKKVWVYSIRIDSSNVKREVQLQREENDEYYRDWKDATNYLKYQIDSAKNKAEII